MRQRVEDLGRLAEKLSRVIEMCVFSTPKLYGLTRPKDAVEVFATLSTDKKDEFIHLMAYGIADLHSEISDCLDIAIGQDQLNNPN